MVGATNDSTSADILPVMPFGLVDIAAKTYFRHHINFTVNDHNRI